jgi:hypothetical protein
VRAIKSQLLLLLLLCMLLPWLLLLLQEVLRVAEAHLAPKQR